jgi:hypothetical protein
MGCDKFFIIHILKILNGCSPFIRVANKCISIYKTKGLTIKKTQHC